MKTMIKTLTIINIGLLITMFFVAPLALLLMLVGYLGSGIAIHILKDKERLKEINKIINEHNQSK